MTEECDVEFYFEDGSMPCEHREGKGHKGPHVLSWISQGTYARLEDEVWIITIKKGEQS